MALTLGTLWKAIEAVALSDAKVALPAVAAATASAAANQGSANLAAQGAALLAVAVKLGPQVEQDEILLLADVVANRAAAAAAAVGTAVTPAQAAAGL